MGLFFLNLGRLGLLWFDSKTNAFLIQAKSIGLRMKIFECVP